MESPKQIKKDKEVDQVFIDVYNEVYKQINGMVKSGGLNLSNLDELIKVGMEAMDSVAYMASESISGTRKAEIVKTIIARVVRDLGKKDVMDKSLADGIASGIELLGPVIFKLVILADKGQLHMHHVHKMLEQSGCCTCL